MNKPEDMTSHDVVSQVRKILKQKSVGHTGTLDPFASGLMILVLGSATKFSDYLRDSDKTYTLTVALGQTTDSFDKMGNVTGTYPLPTSTETIKKVLLESLGEKTLPVPKFSAAKVKGKKLYEYARKGEDVVLPLKTMKFFDLEVHNISLSEFTVTLKCSKGSYVRTWAEEIGRKLGSGAYVKSLVRTQNCQYNLKQSITLKDLEQFQSASQQIEQLKGCFHPLREILPSSRYLLANPKEENLMLHGQIAHSLKNRLITEQKRANRSNQTLPVRVFSSDSGKLLSLLELKPRKFPKIRNVFRSSH